MRTNLLVPTRNLVLPVVLLLLIAAQGCSPATPQNPVNPAVQDAATEAPAATEPPTGEPVSVTLNLYVPASSEAAMAELRTQVETFEQLEYIRADKTREFQVDLTFFDRFQPSDGSPESSPTVFVGETPITLDVNGSIPTIVALHSDELLPLAEQGYIWGADDEMRPYFLFLDDAMKGNTLDGNDYGYPWQRSACSSDFLYLGILHTNHVAGSFADSSYYAEKLMGFLVDPASQYFNLTRARIKPTLRIFYEGSYEGSTAVCPEDTNPLAPTEPPVLEPVTETPAGPPNEAATSHSIDLYLPILSEAANAELQKQIEAFKRSFVEAPFTVQVNVIQYESLNLQDLIAKIPVAKTAGQPGVVVALREPGTFPLAQSQKMFIPLPWSTEGSTTSFLNEFLDEAVQEGTWTVKDASGKQSTIVLSIPWQRFSCSSDYLHLMVLYQPIDVDRTIEQDLVKFLNSPENQRSNWNQAGIYPTLRSFYQDETVYCQEEPNPAGPTEPPATDPVTETPLPPLTLNLYVPNSSEAAKAELQKQVDAFEQRLYQESEEQYQVVVTYFDNLPLPDREQNIPPGMFQGSTPTVVALNNAELLYWAQKRAVARLAFEAWPHNFLSEATQYDMFNGETYGLPWQRYSCSLNFLHLGIVTNNGSESDFYLARQLIWFLTGPDTQKSNLSNAQIYPTLQSFYDEKTVACPVVTNLPLNPTLDGQMLVSAREQAGLFQQRGFQLQPGQAVGIDGTANNTEPGVLKALALPSANIAQTYQDHDVVGSLTVIDPNLTPLNLQLQSKALMQTLKLPPGSFVITCRNRDDCLAISLTGEQFQIDPQSVTWSEQPAPVLAPTVAFEQGSVKVCWYVRKVKYCIRLF